jgi:hypothetical protein
MPKRKIPKKKLKRVPKAKQFKIDWPKVLSSQNKATLIDTLAELIEDDSRLARRLALRFQVEAPPEALFQETRLAIAEATDYDERQINYNFDYDYAAYETVEKNLKKLVKAGDLESAMDLALELMKSGSEQVEMSDEGLMTDDIEDCLHVVITAVKSSTLPAEAKRAWAEKMRHADRVGCICDQELNALVKTE